MNFLNFLLPTFQHFRLLGYWIVLLIALVESLAFIGLVFPGTILVVFAGFLATQGIFDVGDLIWFAAAGAILGDVISFYLGKKSATIFRADCRVFHSKYLVKGERFLQRHGGKSIFLGRFIGPIRPIIPFVAGMFKMETKKFFFWNILSGFCWSIAHVLLGYFFGQAWQAIAVWTTRVSIFLLSIIVFFVAVLWFKRFIVKTGQQLFTLIHSVLASIRQAIVANPDVQKLVGRYPRLLRFLSRRFARDRFSGLPLTFFGFAFLYLFFLLAGTVKDIVTAEPIVSVDRNIASLLVAFRTPHLSQAFLWVSLFGKAYVVASLALVISYLLWLRDKRTFILPLWISLVGSWITVALGKGVLHRPRPALAAYVERSFSFPSGHAALAVVLYGFIVYVLRRHLRKWSTKLNVLFCGLIVAVAIGFSRLYLGVHFVSDVWGGYLLGLLWLIIGVSVAEWLRLQYPSRAVVPPQRVGGISVLVLVMWLTASVAFAVRTRPILLLEPLEPSVQPMVSADVLRAFQDQVLPRYSETLSGQQQEPLSFLMVARDDEQLVAAFQRAGWYLADRKSVAAIVTMVQAAFMNTSYPTAPMTPSFWNNEVHAFGFEQPTEVNSVRQRHHARFWKTPVVTPDGSQVYVGTASLDINLKWGITHQIKPDIDTERDFLFGTLQASGQVHTFQLEQLVDPTMGKNFSGDPFFTDGRAYVVYLD